LLAENTKARSLENSAFNTKGRTIYANLRNITQALSYGKCSP